MVGKAVHDQPRPADESWRHHLTLEERASHVYLRRPFPLDNVPAISRRYSYGPDVEVFEKLVPPVRARGYLTRQELLAVARWKAPWAVPKLAKSAEPLIHEATRAVLAATQEELRVGALTLLHGVSYPIASRHPPLFHKDRYPAAEQEEVVWPSRRSAMSRSPKAAAQHCSSLLQSRPWPLVHGA